MSATTTVTLSGAPARMASSTSRSAVAATGPGREHLFDGVPGHEAGQAVRAEQEPVAGTGFPDHEVRLVAVAAGQDACHEGALRVAVGLLLGDAALVDEGLHEGVVVGDLVELRPAEVRPRVTDVGERHLVTCAEERGHRGAHALELGAVVDLRLDLGVGGRNGPAEVVVASSPPWLSPSRVTMVPMAMELAMSPPAWPPMPSATTRRWGPAYPESWFSERTSPTSERAA